MKYETPSKRHLYPAEYGAWRNVKKQSQAWPTFEEFLTHLASIGTPRRPSPKHQFKRQDLTKPYSATNGAWVAKLPKPPAQDPSPRPAEDFSGHTQGTLLYESPRTNFLWNVYCTACGTSQVLPGPKPYRTCLACGDTPAPQGPKPYAHTPIQSIRDKKAANARVYYALKALKDPKRHRSPQACADFWQNLPKDKDEKQTYVLAYWKKLCGTNT